MIRAALFAAATLCVLGAMAAGAEAAPPQIGGLTVSGVTDTATTLEAAINPQGAKTTYRFEYGLPGCTSDCTKTSSLEIPVGSSPVSVKVPVAGLTASTTYHFRVVATNGQEAVSGFRVFLTFPTGATGGLSDSRAYEQATSPDKDGGDVTGTLALVKAANNGDGITFGSTFGIPGGQGAGALPTYLASRGADWSTQGLLPPPRFGQRTPLLGWLPDFSEAFSVAEVLGTPRTQALVAQSTTDAYAPHAITAYNPKTRYSYVGASLDGSEIFFEAPTALPPVEGEEPIEGALEGPPNLYVWDRASERVSLAGALNDDEAPEKGAFAGPYDWAGGINASALRDGGSTRGYYLQGTHAITAAGDVYFTEAGTGQLYLRRNPTDPQSSLDGQGKCTKPNDACTIHVSASKRAEPDSAGPQPAAFQAASADGSQVFFTSPEKLTDNANTGPDQPPAAIGTSSTSSGTIEDPDFIPKRAIGVAVDSEYVYWADPVGGTIGRAKLNGEDIDESFIVAGESKCTLEENVEIEPGVIVIETEEVTAPSSPRYVAVDAGHIYWTNSGPADQESGEPIDECGTIGRADVEGTPASVEPEFVTGASNPQGIAVNAMHVYWANDGNFNELRSLGRAEVSDGGEAQQKFLSAKLTNTGGVALSPTRVYFALNEEDGGFIKSADLEGGDEKGLFIEGPRIRGVAVDAGHVYWAHQGLGAIGRANLDLTGKEPEFSKDVEGSLNGLAVDASHLYWSVNGEIPINPGNDLYRYQPAAGDLEDLAPLPGGAGAQVQGLLGASEDGSYVYFAANGDLDGAGAGAAGDCHTATSHGRLSFTTGSCGVYLWRPGQPIAYVGRVKAGGTKSTAGYLNWTGTPRELISTGGYTPKSSLVSKDGRTLLFTSSENLTEYDSEGAPELYLYRVGNAKLSCLSCSPSGAAAGEGPGLGSIEYPTLSPNITGLASVQSRNLSADGNRVFFETAEALVPEDTNGQVACPGFGRELTPACQDVYQWEAPGSGTCTKASADYSILNEGCISLISTGKSEFPSYFADASESGADVFFFTRQSLVGQDKDELQDVYDAKVGGGIASQNPVFIPPCESPEGCHGPAQTPPSESSPGSANFVGPNDPKPKRGGKGCPKGKVKQGGKCVKKKKGKAKHGKGHGRANRNGGAAK